MRLRELKKEVYSLSFIPIEDDGARFINVVRRALSIIYCELRINGKRTLVIGKDISKGITGLRHVGGETDALPLAGRAYAVKLSGKGSFTVFDGPLVKTQEFDADEVIFKGFLSYDGKIEFSGPFAYTVVSLVTYSDISSDRLDDIPDESESPIINMEKYPDFFAFSSPPTDSRGEEIRGAVTDGARLILPSGFTGKANVYYRKRPVSLTDDDNEPIDLPAAYLPLLGPLCSALMLIDDDRELSDCYMELYSRMAKGMKKTGDTNVKYVRTNGWA